MPHIDFASILSSALTPITLISGVGLLLMAMSARYAQACDRVRENLRQQGRSPDFDPGIEERLILNYHRAELLRKAILFVVLSAASSGLLILGVSDLHIFDFRNLDFLHGPSPPSGLPLRGVPVF